MAEFTASAALGAASEYSLQQGQGKKVEEVGGHWVGMGTRG